MWRHTYIRRKGSTNINILKSTFYLLYAFSGCDITSALFKKAKWDFS